MLVELICAKVAKIMLQREGGLPFGQMGPTNINDFNLA